MDLELIVTLLVISAAATSAAVEILKASLDKAGITYQSMPIAVIIAFLIGAAEVIIYTVDSGMRISTVTIVYAACMGIANAVGSNVGYDKIRDFICALMSNRE